MAEIGYLRAMFRSGLKVWGTAAGETLVVSGVSLIPLAGAAIRQMLPHNGANAADAFGKAFLSGQLIFYALGLISTIVWNCNKDFKDFFR